MPDGVVLCFILMVIDEVVLKPTSQPAKVCNAQASSIKVDDEVLIIERYDVLQTRNVSNRADITLHFSMENISRLKLLYIPAATRDTKRDTDDRRTMMMMMGRGMILSITIRRIYPTTPGPSSSA